MTVSPAGIELRALADTARLTAEVRDQNGAVMSGIAVAWSSSQADVASVSSSGTVTAVGNGTATITATAGSVSGTATVTVEQRPAVVAVSPATVTFDAIGDTARLAATVVDANGHAVDGAAVSWSSSDEAVATVDEGGLVTAAGAGTARIAAESGSASGEAAVTVAPEPATVQVSPETLLFTAVGDTARLTATVLDANGHPLDGAAVSWSSSDEAVATADEGGLVTAAGAGTARIAAAAGSVSGDVAVTVAQEPATVQVSPETLLFTAVGDTARLTATVLDANGHPLDAAAVSWSTSNAAVATADEGGLVTAAGAGTARIAATAGSVSIEAADAVASISSDRDALVFLYRATGGAAWTRNDNWLSGRPPSDWYGVTADGRGRVTALELQSNNLRGRLPRVIGALDRLRELNLGFNALAGSLPEDWRALTRLRFLSVERTGLGGRLPSWLGDLRSLELLLLSENRFEGAPRRRDRQPGASARPRARLESAHGNHSRELEPPAFAHVPASGKYASERPDPALLHDPRARGVLLRRHEALSPPGPGVPGMVAGYRAPHRRGANTALHPGDRGPGCSHRAVPRNGWPELASPGGLVDGGAHQLWRGVRTDAEGHVTELRLANNWLKGTIPASIGSLTRLEGLRLFGNELEGRIPPEIGNLAELSYLWLSGNPLEGPIPATIGRLAELDSLFIAETGVSGPIPPEIGSLADLRVLWLWENELTGEIPAELGKLSALTDLNLSGNQLRGSIPAQLGGLSSLTNLNLAANRLSGPIPREIGALADLRVLWLWENELTGEMPAELANLSSLEDLTLNENRLTGQIPPELGKLSNLRYLWLFQNELTGVIPPELGRLASLEELSLGRNRIGGMIPPEFGSLTSLEGLNIGPNLLTGPIPREIGNIRTLQHFVAFDTRLSGRIPPELGEIPALTDVQVEGTQLEGLIPRTFMERGLQRLRAGETRLCGQLDEAFQRWLRTIPTVSVNDCDPATVERMALEEVHDRMGGARWTDGTGWKSGAAVGSWHGVSTGAGGRVTGLALPANGLAGELVAELVNLTELEVLDLNDNALAGGVPGDWGLLSDLRELRLDGNAKLSGALPFALTALDRLETFHFSGTGLCRSPAPTFNTWWERIPDRAGAACGNVAEVALTGHAYLVQSVQDLEGGVPLISGRDALLRVFVTADRPNAFYEPEVVARFLRRGRVVHEARMSRDGDMLATEPDESTLAGSYNAEIPGRVIAPGTQLIVEVDPEGVVPLARGSRTRLPEAGALELDVVTAPPLELTVVPILERAAPDSAVFEWTDGLNANSPQVGLFRYSFPFHEFEARSRETYYTDLDLTSEDDQWLLVLELEVVRMLDGGTGYYYGAALSPNGFVRGRARLGGWSSIGKPWDTELAHEVGHTLNLRHAPCGGALDTDPDYPYPDGSTGVWGYDARDGTLVSPHARRDIMGYCYEAGWLSDYYFRKVIDWRSEKEGARAAALAAGPAAEEESLVLWGGVLGGRPRLQPPLRVETAPLLPQGAGAYTLEGFKTDGSTAFSLSFEPGVDKFGDKYFSFAVPVRPDWDDELLRIVLTGPEGSAALDTGDEHRLTVVRDRRTGHVRAMLRDWNGELPTGLRADELDISETAGLRRKR